jgi:hypothetical protein
MADGIVWAAEVIPDQARTYMRAHQKYFRDDALQPGVFKAHDGGMSVDWEKYSTPEESRQRAKEPLRNAVICLIVEGIRDIENLEVQHSPDTTCNPPNRAHSDVLGLPDGGEDLTETRMNLLDISTIVIGL